MVHTFTRLGQYIALDVASGAVHVLDKLAYDVLNLLLPNEAGEMAESCPESVSEALPGVPSQDAADAYGELYGLYKDGTLFSKDEDERFLPLVGRNPIKSVCLHISHDCNMRCKYCFAGTGDYGGKRKLMSPQTAIDAMEFVRKASGPRRNIEVDFFGGEPLLAFDTVVKTVEYVRAREKEWNKCFRFTMTTNGMALDDKKIDFINREMSNVVLSLDGRPEVNDAVRRDVVGNGTYSRVMPKLLKLAKLRGERDHYVRGTYTKLNLDFCEDVLHFDSLGFKQISVEPVVTPDPELRITKADLPAIEAEYNRLAEIMLERKKSGECFNFFHFMIDLEQGPCIIKRLRGCGAGSEYVAVTPDGEVYPCHQFVGEKDFLLGSIYEPDKLNRELMDKFASQNIYTRPACRSCFARFYCSGGCGAANYHENGDISKAYELGCDIERCRLEFAIALKAALAE